MIQPRFKLEFSPPTLRASVWLLLVWLLLAPAELWAQVPLSFRLAHAAAIDAIKPEFTSSNLRATDRVEFDPRVAFGRSSREIQTALAPIVADISPSVVEIRGTADEVTLGTVVSSQGLIVCKQSELPEKFYCVVSDGRKYWANLIGTHPEKDLALLHIAANELIPVALQSSGKRLPRQSRRFGWFWKLLRSDSA